jgi:acetyl-CoA synthetase
MNSIKDNDIILPTPESVAASNVGRWIQELGFETYDDLHQFSVVEMEQFLRAALEKLHIQFRKPFRKVLDISRGPEQPVWFGGARMNIADSVFNMKSGLPAIVSRKEGRSDLYVTSVAELELLSARVANGLTEMGFERGDAIGVDMPMTRECVAIYLGIVRAGMIVVSIADSFASEEIATRLRTGDARAVFTQDFILRNGKSLPLYQRVVAANAPLTVVVGTAVVGTAGPTADMRKHDVRFEDFLSDDFVFNSVDCDPDDPINVLFSSGTTETPKAVPWNHTTPIRCALDGYVHQDIQPSDVVAWPTNVGWMMGPWLIFASLINRATIALYDGAPQTRGFGEFVQDAGVTMLGVIPSLVRGWKASECMNGLDWSRIRTFSSTGEASNVEDMRWLMAQAGGKPVIEYCGGTETGGAYITSTLAEENRPSHFSAKTIASDFVILNDVGTESDEGEVFLVPPALGHSTRLLNARHHETYFENCPPGPDGKILRRHGDQMRAVEGGFYRALGRADDTMNLGGIKVSSVELERTLNRLEGVVETAAVAVAPQGGGPSELVVYAVLDAEFDRTDITAQLQHQIHTELNPLFKIAKVHILNDLPRTASGKITRRHLPKT